MSNTAVITGQNNRKSFEAPKFSGEVLRIVAGRVFTIANGVNQVSRAVGALELSEQQKNMMSGNASAYNPVVETAVNTVVAPVEALVETPKIEAIIKVDDSGTLTTEKARYEVERAIADFGKESSPNLAEAA